MSEQNSLETRIAQAISKLNGERYKDYLRGPTPLNEMLTTLTKWEIDPARTEKVLRLVENMDRLPIEILALRGRSLSDTWDYAKRCGLVNEIGLQPDRQKS